MMRPWRTWLLLLLVGCGEGVTGGPDDEDASEVLESLESAGIIPPALRSEGDSIIGVGIRVMDSLRSAPRPDDLGYWWAGYVEAAIERLVVYHRRGLLDRVRTANLIDQIAVTLEFVRGSVLPRGEQYYPVRTPHLTWVFYGGLGIFFQPVTSIERIAGIPLVDPAVATDSLAAAGEALWARAVWHSGSLGPFPVWEYDFSWRSNYLDLRAPWRSGMAQGEALKLYSELYHRTGSSLWRDRARAVFQSMMTPWGEGGMLSPDTTHGYWWDEYDPAAMVWNGSMVALIGVGLYADATGDPDAQRAWVRGLDAARYWTQYIDDGKWTRYSLLAGYVIPPYHAWHIQIAEALFQLTGDPVWSEYAARWKSYAVPPQFDRAAIGPNAGEAPGDLPLD